MKLDGEDRRRIFDDNVSSANLNYNNTSILTDTSLSEPVCIVVAFTG